MAEPIGALRAEMSADAARFEQDMGKARRAVRNSTSAMNRDFGGTAKAYDKAFESLRRYTRFAVISAGATGLVMFIKRNLEAAASIRDTADKVGVGVEALQEYRFAAQQTGVEQNVLDMALQRFSRRVGEAAQGGGELKATLEQYGIQVRDTEGRQRRLEDVLDDYADTIRRAESDQERLRLSFKGFDSEGAAFVNTLRNGREGLKGLRQEARRTGNVISEIKILGAAEATDRLSVLGSTIRTQLMNALINATPAIMAASDAMSTFIARIGDYIDQSSLVPLEFKSVRFLERDLEGLKEQLVEAEQAQKRFIQGRSGIGSSFQFETGLISALKSEIERYSQALEKARSREGRAKGSIPVIDAQAAAVERLKNALQFQVDLVGKTAEQQEVLNALRSAGIKAGTKEAREVERLINLKRGLQEIEAAIEEGRQAEIEHLNRIHDEAMAAAEINERLQQQADLYSGLKDETDEWSNASRNAADAIGTAFEDALIAGENFRGVLQGILKDIERIILRIGVTQPLEAGLQTLFNITGKFITDLFGPSPTFVQGSVAGSMPVRQHGGRITGPSLVGERGPEIYVPDRPGMILPNSFLREIQGGRFGESTNFNQILNVSPGVPETVRREVVAMLPMIRAQAVQAMVDAGERGGLVSKKMGRRR